MIEDTRETQPMGPQMMEMLTIDELNALIDILQNVPVTMPMVTLLDDRERERIVGQHVNLINKLGRMAQQVK